MTTVRTFPVPSQSKEYRNQNEQLQIVNTNLGSEVNKLQKELELIRDQQSGGGQVTSLQEEIVILREELQDAHAHRKKIEEVHCTEKQDLRQVSPASTVLSVLPVCGRSL